MGTAYISFLLIFVYQLNGEIIQTLSDAQYKNETINCNQAENCTIICDKTDSCSDSIMICPNDYPCHIHCNGINSCRSAIFKLPKNNIHSLECSGTSACSQIAYTPYFNSSKTINQWILDSGGSDSIFSRSVFTCPPNTICNFNCIGYFACAQTTFNCLDATSECNLICNKDYSCDRSIFNGYGTIKTCIGYGACFQVLFPIPPATIDYKIACNGSYACLQSTIKCPDSAECVISCDGIWACGSTEQLLSDTTTYHNHSCNNIYGNVCRDFNNASIIAPDDDQSFSVDCNQISGMCRSKLIICPKNASCSILCGALNGFGCDDSLIIGPINHQFIVNCSKDRACQGTNIHAEYVSDFYLYVTDEIVTVWFPPNVNGTPRAIIDSVISGQPVVIHPEFYCINGWNDIEIVNDIVLQTHHGRMICGDHYSSICTVDSLSWQCQDYGFVTCIQPTSSASPTTGTPTTDTPAPIAAPTTSPITSVDICVANVANRCHGKAKNCHRDSRSSNSKYLTFGDEEKTEWCAWCLCADISDNPLEECAYYALLSSEDDWRAAFVVDILKDFFMEICFENADCTFDEVKVNDKVAECDCEQFTCGGIPGTNPEVNGSGKYGGFGIIVVMLTMNIWM